MIIVDDVDKPLLEKHNWYVNTRGYVIYKKNERDVLLHRIIMECPDGMVVDHINRDKLDNRRSNLRICTTQENSRNAKLRVDNTTGYKGVIRINDAKKRTKPYKAVIRYDGKKHFIGCYATPEEAHEAYKIKAVEYHGDFASY